MRLEWDEGKRATTLRERRLDFARAGDVFAGLHATAPDEREYDEPRFITVGWLDRRVVVLVWTPRGAARRIISMRKANAREQVLFQAAIDGR